MSPEQREQIRRVLDYKSATSKHHFEERRKAIYARNSGDGCLQSGGTIRQVVRMMEETAGSFITYCVEQISAVAQDSDAFADLLVGFDEFWAYLNAELHSTVRLAGGKSVSEDEADSTSRAARKLFDRSGSLLKQRLELYRFTFTKPILSPPSQTNAAQVVDSQPVVPKRNVKGGRPLAEHWDDMWAAVAFALYNGDLIPKSQADIENEMLGWLEANGFGAATSTVRGRARRLWDRLQGGN
jgi:hypothetical protein